MEMPADRSRRTPVTNSGKTDQVIIYTDGGSRGNPGPGAAAYLLKRSDGSLLEGRADFLDETTNNYAEYLAVLQALKAAQRHGMQHIELFSDSELLVRQLNGQYKVKSANLLQLYSRCMECLSGFASWKVTHVPREQNKEADALANRAMDKKGDIELLSAQPQPAGKPLRLAVLISGGGRTMLNLYEEIRIGRLHAKVVLVISSRREIKGIERAREIGIEPVVIRKKEFPGIAEFSKRIEEELVKTDVDLVLQAGWLCLWRIPAAYENRVMNIHPALLPSFGGQGMWGHHVHEAVLNAGCKVSGCTVHFCTNEYDAGPIILQRCCEVLDDDDPDTLAARVFKEETLAYPEAVKRFARGALTVKGGRVFCKKI